MTSIKKNTGTFCPHLFSNQFSRDNVIFAVCHWEYILKDRKYLDNKVT